MVAMLGYCSIACCSVVVICSLNFEQSVLFVVILMKSGVWLPSKEPSRPIIDV